MTDGNHDHPLIDGLVVNEEARAKAAEAALEARIAKLEGGSVPVPPTPTPLSGAYGPATNCDSKSNLQVGWTNRARLSHRFRATNSGPISTVRFAQRAGNIYSGGTGGLLRVSIQADKNGAPDGTLLGSASYGPKNTTTYDAVSIIGSASIVAGNLYHIVYENVDASPTTNYLSVNHLFVFGSALKPRQPKSPDSDMAVLYDSGSGWVVQGQFTPVFDAAYASGGHDGQGYVGMIGAIPASNVPVSFANVSGTSSARERFTPATDRTVTKAFIRLRRATGTAPLQVWLDSDSPVLLGSIPSTDVPISAAGGDNGGSVWASVSWINGLALRAGTEYSLRLSCPSGTTYTVAPIRSGDDAGFSSALCFKEGVFEYTTDGSTWKQMYAYSPLDMQEYLT